MVGLLFASSTGVGLPLSSLTASWATDVVNGHAVGKVEARGALLVLHAVGYGDHREHQQRGDLNDVDRHVDRRGPVYAAVGDIGHAEGEDDTEAIHEQGAVVVGAEGVGPELVQQIAAEDRGHARPCNRDRPSSTGGSPSR